MVGPNRPLNSCIFQSLRATTTCQRSKPPRLGFENKEQENDELIHPSKRKRRYLPEDVLVVSCVCVSQLLHCKNHLYHLETIMGFRKEKWSPSSTSPCAHLRTAYQHCFNRWYSEKFLKGQWDKEECVTEWQKYRACLSTASLAQKNSEIARTLAEMGRVRNRKKMIVPVVKNKQPTVDQVTGEKILKSSVFSMSRKKLPSSLSHLEMDLRKLMLPYTALELKLSSSTGEMRWSIMYKFI